MRFFTSDTHFGHANIIKYTNRPFKDYFHMDEVLIENWNNVVGEDDWVFHMGDVALGPWERWDSVLTRLNGKKVLIIGNHDRIFDGESQKHRTRFMPEYKKWFDIISSNGSVTLEDGTEVNLSHFPYEMDHTADARYMEYRLPDVGNTLIHGHTHSKDIITRSASGSLQIHVGQDAWDYTPVSEEQIITLIKSETERFDARDGIVN